MIGAAARVSRRGVVAVAAVGVVGGCSGGEGAARPAAEAPAPGVVEKARAARDSAGLLARYDGALAAHPELAGRLAPLRAEVARHVRAFGGRAAPPATGTPGTPGTPAASPPPRIGAAATLTALATAERELADRRAKTLLTVPGELARLLASVAAAGAGHVVLLGRQDTASGAAGRTT
ncbi:hypothetical protein ACFO3J_03700 [Streptomyces polygonati]|uniref:Lipoprotein n=1 Tax=Streptomyces polygonati TaxID=1617087 RepID=A0ABV8HI30_9ACTN